MKKRNGWLGVICWGIFLVGFCGCAASTPPVRLAAAGKPAGRIVYLEKHRTDLAPAANELQSQLERATGARLPVNAVASLPAAASGNEIVLGLKQDFPRRAADFGLDRLGPEGIAVCTAAGRLWLLGNSPQAVRHAVMTFLEKIGFRWYFPDPVWTVTPHLPDLAVRDRLVTEPAFAWRRIWYGWGPRTPKLRKDYDAWMRHNRQGGSFQVDCGHAWARYVPPRLFTQHPEWFALVKGKRKPPQLCVANRAMQQHFIEGVLSVFRKHPERLMVSVEPNDGGGYCECPKCRALGSQSDEVFYLANLAARAVARAFPGKWVGLYAYAGHAAPPHFRLASNVYVQVTTGFRYTKLSFDSQVRAFRNLGARLGVYDYFSVYPWDWDLPGAAKAGRVHRLAQSIRHYHELGLSTYTAESSCNWGPNGPGYWIAAHLMWNPMLDSHRLLEDFCKHAFRAAAPPMQRLYERWSRGERFSPRTLKLALLDLRAAYAAESAPDVQARLDRVAMYLHWLRLWLDYDRSSRCDEWNHLVVASPKQIQENAHRCIVFARRIMDTGLIHAWPMLYTSWFRHRFGALKRLPNFDFAKTTKAWKNERKDIPKHGEMQALFAADLQRFAALQAVEIRGRRWTGPLVPLAVQAPGLVRAWGKAPASHLAVESGEILFRARAGEKIHVTWEPYGRGHSIDGRWRLRRGDRTVASARIQAPKGRSAAAVLSIPETGLYALNPGTGYWHAARIELDGRPQVFRARRAKIPGRPASIPLRFWLPRLNRPLYFFVPKGVHHFVIGIVSGGTPWTRLRLKTAGGRTVLDDKVLAGSEVSVIVETDRREYGAASAIANHCILPAAEQAVTVPAGADGQVWSLELSSLRCVIELYDIPPFLAPSPAQLLVPADALAPRQAPQAKARDR